MPVKETFCTVEDGDKQTDLDSSRVPDVALDDDSGLFPVHDNLEGVFLSLFVLELRLISLERSRHRGKASTYPVKINDM